MKKDSLIYTILNIREFINCAFLTGIALFGIHCIYKIKFMSIADYQVLFGVCLFYALWGIIAYGVIPSVRKTLKLYYKTKEITTTRIIKRNRLSSKITPIKKQEKKTEEKKETVLS